MPPPRVLVVSGSAGYGHVMAGRAVAGAIRRRHPTVDVVHVDALKEMAGWFRRTYRWCYLRLVDRQPLLWRALYDRSDRRSLGLGQALTVLGGRRFVDLCRRWKPHVVVCTHFLAPELLSRAIRATRLDTNLQVVVTDHDIHRAWYYPEVRRYYVPSELVKARLSLRYGVSEERIRVTGIPVRPGFAGRHDRTGVRARLGLDPGRPVVLFFSGGFAAGPIRQSILGLWMERRDIQVVAVCGRNAALRRRIAALPRPAGAVLQALGFVERPGEVMAVADVVVTKSGGVSVSEITAAGRPILVSASIPGQEERNADALVEAGAAAKALTPEEVRWRVCRLLEEPERLQAMARAAKAFGRPRAAAEIADAAVEGLEEEFVARPRFHGAT